jgi:diaminopimelate decarboxylase
MLSTEIIAGIAKTNSKPMYIFDKTALKKRMAEIKNILGSEVTLAYAMKANPFLVDAFKGLDCRFEVCSPGEFAICERERVDMGHIVLSGVNKEEADICHVMDDCGGVGVYTVESRNQLELLNACASSRDITINVLLRVTSGNQFGMDEDEIFDIAKNKEAYKNVNITGLQCYSGTQKKKCEIFETELNRMVELSDRLNAEFGCHLTEIEYGPGLAYRYFGEDAYCNDYEELKVLAGYIKSICGKFNVTLEMGRYLVSECGVYVTSVADMKTNMGQNYVIVDGGINHLNYYGQTMAMKVPAYAYVKNDGTIVKDYGAPIDETEKWTVCGSLCTVADVIVKNLPIGTPNLGDMIIFYNTGAYSVTEGIYLFLSRKMPLITAVSYDATADTISMENIVVEVYRDVFASDVINSRKKVL